MKVYKAVLDGITKVVSVLLILLVSGIVLMMLTELIAAYVEMYKFSSTSYFSTMQFLSKAWHFLPMAIAGGFMLVDSIYQLLDQFTNPQSNYV